MSECIDKGCGGHCESESPTEVPEATSASLCLTWDSVARILLLSIDPWVFFIVCLVIFE